MKLQPLILKFTPLIIQNLLVSIVNTYLYKRRRSGRYFELRKVYTRNFYLPKSTVIKEAQEMKQDFLNYACSNSKWYSSYIDKPLDKYPFLEKENIVNNLDKIITIPRNQGVISLTGGTTGASMEVLYTHEDVIERQAILDSFRSMHGYELGKKTAWFSGKDIVTEKNIENGNCYRDDWVNKIRFFSTFYISPQNFEVYWAAFVKFSPEYIVGFPSSLYDLCLTASKKNIQLKGVVKVFFPTAESMLEEQKTTIKNVLGCKIVDQYASSEGAPFIIQCPKGSLHLHPYTGVFEVLDDTGQTSNEGELVVTAFHTHGTPLIRYKIGDRIRLADNSFTCNCRSSFPVVENIIGRNNDFIWSKERGRVNLGNISNCTKDTNGILCFQIEQNSLTEIKVSIVASNNFTTSDKNVFIKNLRKRIGKSVKINTFLVDTIPREKSGKFRLVKNNIHSIIPDEEVTT